MYLLCTPLFCHVPGVEYLLLNVVIMNNTLVIVFALLAVFVEGDSVVIKQHAIRICSFKAFDMFSF